MPSYRRMLRPGFSGVAVGMNPGCTASKVTRIDNVSTLSECLECAWKGWKGDEGSQKTVKIESHLTSPYIKVTKNLIFLPYFITHLKETLLVSDSLRIQDAFVRVALELFPSGR